mmetsp:Transcript_14884/g.26209  ORF Transcript_14884/g.26209 Transcript_14884/m.26209 type:complete len:80 (+) Transcript_14884:105-344(+)
MPVPALEDEAEGGPPEPGAPSFVEGLESLLATILEPAAGNDREEAAPAAGRPRSDIDPGLAIPSGALLAPLRGLLPCSS